MSSQHSSRRERYPHSRWGPPTSSGSSTSGSSSITYGKAGSVHRGSAIHTTGGGLSLSSSSSSHASNRVGGGRPFFSSSQNRSESLGTSESETITGSLGVSSNSSEPYHLSRSTSSTDNGHNSASNGRPANVRSWGDPTGATSHHHSEVSPRPSYYAQRPANADHDVSSSGAGPSPRSTRSHVACPSPHRAVPPSPSPLRPANAQDPHGRRPPYASPASRTVRPYESADNLESPHGAPLSPRPCSNGPEAFRNGGLRSGFRDAASTPTSQPRPPLDTCSRSRYGSVGSDKDSPWVTNSRERLPEFPFDSVPVSTSDSVSDAPSVRPWCPNLDRAASDVGLQTFPSVPPSTSDDGVVSCRPPSKDSSSSSSVDPQASRSPFSSDPRNSRDGDVLVREERSAAAAASPPPAPPSSYALAVCRLAEAVSQMEYAYARHLVLTRRHERVAETTRLLESSPVGEASYRTELEALQRSSPKTAVELGVVRPSGDHHREREHKRSSRRTDRHHHHHHERKRQRASSSAAVGASSSGGNSGSGRWGRHSFG